jgi:hypothetical protein
MATTSGAELGEVFEQAEAVAAGPEVPVEHGEVDRVLVGDLEGRLGVGDGDDAGVRHGGDQPLAERPADGLLVVHDEHGVGHR